MANARALQPKVFGVEYTYARTHRHPANQKNLERWTWRPHNPGAISDPEPFKRRVREFQSYAAQTNYSPRGCRQKVVLIFDTGVMNPGLKRWLTHDGLKFFYLRFDQLIEQGVITLRLSSDCGSGTLAIGKATLDLRDVAAVVWNPPQLPWSIFNNGEGGGRKRRGKDLFMKRWGQLLRDLRGLVPADTLWLPSHPLNGSQDWQNKLAELALAARAGLRVPHTICTNDPQVAAEFFRNKKGSVLFREFSWPPWSFPIVQLQELPSDTKQTLPSAPCTFQAYVEKDFEVRAVVVGDKVFACRIDSQASPLASLDWRAHDDARVRWDRCRLPRRVEAAMLRLMKRLDLTFGSFDLIKGKDGHFYFLEVNRPGASMWLLNFVGLDTPREISAFLKSRFDGKRS